MLVLSRKAEETILVGDNIKFTVLGIEGDKVKLGVEAPISMRILREELIRQTGEENIHALHSPLITFDLQAMEPKT
jgi:carbon storage regulator